MYQYIHWHLKCVYFAVIEKDDLFLEELKFNIDYYLKYKVKQRKSVYVLTNFIYNEEEMSLIKKLIKYYKDKNVSFKILNLDYHNNSIKIGNNSKSIKKWYFIVEQLIASKAYCFLGSIYSGVATNMIIRRGFDKCYGYVHQ